MARSKPLALNRNAYLRVFGALVVSNGVSIILFLFRAADARSWRYAFLLWNLLLGWAPLLFAWWLKQRLSQGRWLTWQNLLLTGLWLGFLPNSFYLVSDLIHLHSTGEVSLLYDAVMFFSFIFNGYVAGFASVYLVHRELLRRLNVWRAHALVAFVLLLCSFAIYLGRNLRWNTWDVLVNPFGILFDVSDRIINPLAHPQVFTTTFTFFILLTSMYAVIWQFVVALRGNKL
jgi:uncharacterized membrane protein